MKQLIFSSIKKFWQIVLFKNLSRILRIIYKIFYFNCISTDPKMYHHLKNILILFQIFFKISQNSQRYSIKNRLLPFYPFSFCLYPKCSISHSFKYIYLYSYTYTYIHFTTHTAKCIKFNCANLFLCSKTSCFYEYIENQIKYLHA